MLFGNYNPGVLFYKISDRRRYCRPWNNSLNNMLHEALRLGQISNLDIYKAVCFLNAHRLGCMLLDRLA